MRMISGYSWRKPKGTDTCAWCGVLIEISQDTGSRELIDSDLVGVGMEGARLHPESLRSSVDALASVHYLCS